MVTVTITVTTVHPQNSIFLSDKAMDDELRLIIETAIPYAIPATLQLMIFVYVTNLAKDKRKYNLIQKIKAC